MIAGDRWGGEQQLAAQVECCRWPPAPAPPWSEAEVAHSAKRDVVGSMDAHVLRAARGRATCSLRSMR